MTAFKLTSFSGGELAPQLYGRTDLARYLTSASTMRNFIPTKTGSAENRAGTEFVTAAKNPTDTVRLVKFVVAQGVSYVMEFGKGLGGGIGYIRFCKNGAPILYGTQPAYSAITTYTIGQMVTYGGFTWWSKADGNVGNTPAVGVYWYREPATGELEVPTSIDPISLPNMQTAQVNDIMILVSDGFRPQQLTRYSDTYWRLENYVAGNPLNAPTASVVISSGGPVLYTYVVTVYDGSGESLPGTAASASGPILSGTCAAQITWPTVPGAVGYYIYRFYAGNYAQVGTTTSTAFTDTAPVPSPGTPPPSVSGTTLLPPPASLSIIDTGSVSYNYAVTVVDSVTLVESTHGIPGTASGSPLSSSVHATISWTAISGAAKYNIYRFFNGVYAFVGSAGSAATSFVDDNIAPAVGIQPPTAIPMFTTTNDWPKVVSYYQQRLVFANTQNQPQTVWCSKVGAYNCFNVSTPVQDNDAIQFTVAGRVVHEIRAAVDIGKLILHTSFGEYVVNGDQAGALKPTAINLVQQSYAGSTFTVPVSIGNTDIFVQQRGNIIRDLRYEVQSFAFAGKDTTIYSPHLFANKQVTRIDWQQVPDSLVWAVLDSGELVSMPYIREQDIWGWSRHDTYGGKILDVVVIPEDTEDGVYVLVSRRISGTPVKYIERLSHRNFTDISVDAIFTDCTLSYDGRNTGATTIDASTSGGWTTTDTITLTASAPTFAATDVGDAYVLMQYANGTQLDPATNIPYPVGTVLDRVTFNVIAYTSTTIIKALPEKDVPSWAQVALTSWGKAVHNFSGFTELLGSNVAVLGDGMVEPNLLFVDTGGVFTTTRNYMIVHAGLPITAQLQTLDLENTQGETISNKKKLITEICINFYNSRGGFYGQDAQHLVRFKTRNAEPWAVNDYLITGPYRVPVQGTWQTTGRIFIQQTEPLPIGISAIAPTGQVGN